MKKLCILLMTLVLALSFTGYSSYASQECNNLESKKESIEKNAQESNNSNLSSRTEEFDSQKALKNISSKTYKISDGFVALLKNNNSFPIYLKASNVYYDDKGEIITEVFDENRCFEPGSKCCFFLPYPADYECNLIKFAKYKLTYSVTESQKPGSISSIHQELKIMSNKAKLKLTNKGDKDLSVTCVYILFYSKKKIIAYSRAFPKLDKPGSVDTFNIRCPYGNKKGKIDDYKIFINYSY